MFKLMFSLPQQSSGLLVTFRTDLKVDLLEPVYKSPNGLGPLYMENMLIEYKPNRPDQMCSNRSHISIQIKNTSV